MVFSIHDFTDSEGESEVDQRPYHDARRGGGSGRGRAMTPSSPVAAAPLSSLGGAAGTSASTSSAHPLRITLRPNLSHLVDTTKAHPSTTADKSTSQRSSLSPPPPITLKLSRQSLAEKAAYSSSEDDEPRPSAPTGGAARKKPPSKRPKASGSSKPGTSAPVSPALGSAPQSKLPAQHRKTYDWLTPSSASASHSGPPERERERSRGSISAGAGSSAPSPSSSMKRDLVEEELDPLDELLLASAEPKKTGSKRKAEPGPGRNWRSKVKKNMAAQLKVQREERSVEGSPVQPFSPAGSPEPINENADIPKIEIDADRDPGPFERADPDKLGFPVFAKPIVNPKFTLGAFPRVTQFFAQINGGDSGPFPRKEQVRSWRHQEMTLLGIGGGALKYKSWHRGPPSHLGRLIQADREVKDIQRAAKKANAAATAANAAATAANAAAPAPASLPSETTWDRPPLVQSISTDSVPPLQSTQEDDASEAGDEDLTGSAAALGASPGTGPKGGKKRPAAAGSRPKAKPRKSKLAQEISVDADIAAAM